MDHLRQQNGPKETVGSVRTPQGTRRDWNLKINFNFTNKYKVTTNMQQCRHPLLGLQGSRWNIKKNN
jgi:hypothetical protein